MIDKISNVFIKLTDLNVIQAFAAIAFCIVCALISLFGNGNMSQTLIEVHFVFLLIVALLQWPVWLCDVHL